MSLRDRSIAVVGATGAVGAELLALLARLGIKPGRVTPYASDRSAGRELNYGNYTLTTRALSSWSPDSDRHDIALFAASSTIAREYAPKFTEAGALVIDNSSAFRMDDRVPLVVPEVNGEVIANDSSARIIANPNCSTIILLMPAHPIRERWGCRKLIVSTYQAVSGAGAEGITELSDQAARVLAGERPEPSFFAEPCAFNVFSHDSDIDPESGSNTEEAKMTNESRKIWGDPEICVNATCVRVPVFRAHTESVHMSLAEPASIADIRAALEQAPGVRVIDDRERNDHPTALKASDRHDVLVGRLRHDPSAGGPESCSAVQFLVSGDQLLKGAALNALQIAMLAIDGSVERFDEN